MQENPYGINSCSRSPAELQGSHARVRPHWGLVRWVTVWGEAFWVNFHTVQLSRPAKQSPWWQLMRPALRATCQLRPSASWHRGDSEGGMPVHEHAEEFPQCSHRLQKCFASIPGRVCSFENQCRWCSRDNGVLKLCCAPWPLTSVWNERSVQFK